MKHIAKILVFALVLSMLCIGGASAASDCEGVWAYDDYYLWFEFNSDDTWSEYNRDGLLRDGYYEVSGDTIETYFRDGTGWYELELDGDVMTDDEGDTLSPGELPDFDDSDLAERGFTGVWEYDDGDSCIWFQIYDAGTFIMYTEEDGALLLGSVRMLDKYTIGLYESSDDDDDDSILTLELQDGMLVDEAGEELVPGELPYEGVSESSDTDDADSTTVSVNAEIGDVRTNDDTYRISFDSIEFTDKAEIGAYTGRSSSGYTLVILHLTFTNLSAETVNEYTLWSHCIKMSLIYADKYSFNGSYELEDWQVKPLEQTEFCIIYEVPDSAVEDTDSMIATFMLDGDTYAVDCRAD